MYILRKRSSKQLLTAAEMVGKGKGKRQKQQKLYCAALLLIETYQELQLLKRFGPSLPESHPAILSEELQVLQKEKSQ